MAKRYCILSYKVLILAIICCFINANAQAAPILKLNSHGHDVIVLQQNLIRMNYDLSKVSGNYDKETQEAVKAFQKDHKIKVTGIVNRETWWAIKSGKQNVIVNSQSSINEKIILDNLSSVPYGRQFLSKKEVPGIIATAKDYIGVPYVFGGDTPAGFDCSGYLEYVFAKHGIRIPRTADEQYKLGKLVEPDDLEAGDLVFFNTSGKGISHVGMYIGDSKFIHASTSKGVRIDSLNSSYYKSKFVSASKIIK